MPAPLLSSSDPADSAVNVYLNSRITLTWDQAMQVSTMSPALILLEDTDVDEPVDVTIDYTAGETDAVVIPDRQLEPETTYRLQLIGADTATSLGAIKADDASDLATTVVIYFTTGTEIETTGLPKTPQEEVDEGDLDLPSDVVVRPNNFYICETNPENRAWDVVRSLDEIRIKFSGDVDLGRVNDQSVRVDIFPFLEDAQHYAVPAYKSTTLTGEPQFEWEGDEDATGGSIDFDPPTGSLSVVSDEIIWTRDPNKAFPYNACVEVTLDRTLSDESNNALTSDQRFTFYVNPWPDWISPRRVRRALHPIDLTDYPDDVLGLALWNASVEVGDLMRWVISDMELPERIVRQLVECKTIADIFRMLLAQKQMDAGEYMRLGDMEHEVKYPTSRAADSKPEKLREAEECIRKIEAKIRNYWLSTPRTFIKGRLGAYERPDYRTRIWRNPGKHLTYDATPVVEAIPAGNTASERWPTSPGRQDPWS